MLSQNEISETAAFLNSLLMLLFGLAPIAVTLAVKMALYRRRVAEDEGLGLPADGSVQPIPERRKPRARLARRHRRSRFVRPPANGRGAVDARLRCTGSPFKAADSSQLTNQQNRNSS
jgi:hypothetical protein